MESVARKSDKNIPYHQAIFPWHRNETRNGHADINGIDVVVVRRFAADDCDGALFALANECLNDLHGRATSHVGHRDMVLKHIRNSADERQIIEIHGKSVDNGIRKCLPSPMIDALGANPVGVLNFKSRKTLSDDWIYTPRYGDVRRTPRGLYKRHQIVLVRFFRLVHTHIPLQFAAGGYAPPSASPFFASP